MWPFNLGAAVIRKGTSYALIDTAGNFIIPYNRYSLISNIPSLGNGIDIFYPNGIFWVRIWNANPKSYFINNKGKVLLQNYSSDFKTRIALEGKYIVITTGAIPNVTTIIIDKDGNRRVIHDKSALNVYDNVFIFSEPRKDGYSLIGLKDLQGNILFKPIFTEIEPFQDGIALVSIKDEFGRTRSGAINEKGKFTYPHYTLRYNRPQW